ncbi:DUF4391 domain-containing protein [Sporosarcina sp. BP05]|uniref:DUF4391 domain-containing protein n=1 Tax=Sporosarcina sp. BP05 TaxID=2758726 RepID=UPI00164609DB
MDEKEVLESLNLPKSTHVLRTFPYVKLATQFTADEKKVFSEVVEARGVRLLATINPKTTNITAYEDEETSYQEIHLFKIKVNQLTRAERIYKIIAEAMPYPLIIMFEANDHVKWISATHKKIAKTGLLKMDKLFTTDLTIPIERYLEKWAFAMSDTYNLKTYYDHFIQQILQVELQQNYQIHAESSNGMERLEEIKDLEKQIADYVAKAKREVQMNKRIEWQTKANELKIRLQNTIKGEIK